MCRVLEVFGASTFWRPKGLSKLVQELVYRFDTMLHYVTLFYLFRSVGLPPCVTNMYISKLNSSLPMSACVRCCTGVGTLSLAE